MTNENDGWIMPLFNLILSGSSRNKDMVNLYKVLPDLETFVKVIKLFGGRRVKFPTSEEIDDNMTLALVYYYRYEQGLSWEDVKKIIPREINPVEYAAKISAFNNQLRKKINTLMELYAFRLKNGRPPI